MAHQYKVLTQKDRFMSGKFNPEVLETALNGYASEGWRVIGVTTGEIGGGLGKREEMIFILEREV